MVVAGAPPRPRPSSDVEAELGWEFIQIYRPHRDLAAAHHQPDARRSGTASSRPSGAHALAARACLRWACAWRWTGGEILARSNHVYRGLLEPARGDGQRAIVDGWFHTGDGGHERRRLHRDRGPEEGRHHHRRRERAPPSRWRTASSSTPRSLETAVIGDPRREVGRDHQGAGGPPPGSGGHRAGADRVLPRPHVTLQVPDLGRVPRQRSCEPPPASSSSSCASRTGRAATAVS